MSGQHHFVGPDAPALIQPIRYNLGSSCYQTEACLGRVRDAAWLSHLIGRLKKRSPYPAHIIRKRNQTSWPGSMWNHMIMGQSTLSQNVAHPYWEGFGLLLSTWATHRLVSGQEWAYIVFKDLAQLDILNSKEYICFSDGLGQGLTPGQWDRSEPKNRPITKWTMLGQH